MNENISTLITQEEIAQKIKLLAVKIAHEYSGRSPVFLVVLKGSFMFAADLIRASNIPCSIDFIQASSYGSTTKTSGQVQLSQTPCLSLESKDVIIVEDIVDTGFTIDFLIKWLKERKVQTIRTASLLFKPSRQIISTQIDYLGFTIEDVFVVGYGLDFDQKYRHLPYVGVLHES